MSNSNKPFFRILLTETDEGLMDLTGEVPLDVVSTRTYRFQAQITENPIEDGSTVNDHVIIKPDVITAEGFVSSVPVTRASGVAAPAQVPLKGNTEPGLGENRPQSAYDMMEDIFRGKKPVAILAEYSLYDDMLLESWETTKSKDRGRGFFFTATFKKVVTVATLTGTLPPDVVSALKRRRAKKIAAKKAATTASNLTAQQATVIDEGKKSKTTTDADTKATSRASGSAFSGALGRTR